MSARGERHPTLLPWFAAGRLDPAATEVVEEHLRVCESCRAEVSALRSVYRSVRAASAVDHISPALLVAYRAGGRRVPDSERRSMQEHLESCPACAADLHILERAEASERGRRGPALFAAVASVVIVAVVASWRTETHFKEEPVAVVFTPPQRGAPAERILSGKGPWLVQAWLPGLTSAQVYRATIRGADAPPESLSDELVTPASKDKFLLVKIPDRLAPGRYELSLVPRDGDGSDVATYGFRVEARR